MTMSMSTAAVAEAVDVTPPAGESERYERDHVHRVYDQIAAHFSATRYKVCTVRVRARAYTF